MFWGSERGSASVRFPKGVCDPEEVRKHLKNTLKGPLWGVRFLFKLNQLITISPAITQKVLAANSVKYNLNHFSAALKCGQQ